MKTAVIILNWNGKDWLEKFLPLVIERSPNALIVVADNGSDDDSLIWIESNYSNTLILRLGINLGYAGGYNKAIEIIRKRYTDIPYAVLLNSDIEPNVGWLTPLEKRMDSESKVGAIQPKILDFYCPSKFEYAGAGGGLMDKWGYPFARGRIFDKIEHDNGQFDTPEFESIFWASGACLMLRISAFIQSGRLDDRLFAHMEEIDLCWRMHRSGWDVESCSSSSVLHVGGGTLNASSPQKTYLNFRNSLLIIVKNAPTLDALRIISARLFLDGVAGALFLIRGQEKHFYSILKAHFSFYKMFSAFAITPQKFKKKWPKSGLYNGSIVWDYFILKRK